MNSSAQKIARSEARHETIILAAVAIATTLAPLNSTMIAVALPDIMKEFGVDYAYAGWLVITYLIAMAAIQPVAGKLGDWFGRRRLVLAGLLGFAVASGLAMLAVNFPMLLICRVGQALCGATALPNTAALVYEIVPVERRASRFGIVGAIASFAAAAGPPIGGLLVSIAGWRAIFSANLPIVLVALLIGWWVFPRTGKQTVRKRFDYSGSILLSLVLSGTAILLSQHSAIAGSGLLIPAIAGLIALAALFFWHELHTEDPILPLRLFRIPAFSAANASNALSNLAMYVTLLTIPILLAGHGWTSFASGVLLSALSGATVLFAPLGGRLADRFGRRKPAMGGLALLTVGTVPFTLLGSSLPVPLLVGSLFICGSGLGLASASMQSVAVEAAATRQAGVASGVYSTCRYLGSIVGSSALASMTVATPGATTTYTPVFIMVAIAAALATLASAGFHVWPARTAPAPK